MADAPDLPPDPKTGGAYQNKFENQPGGSGAPAPKPADRTPAIAPPKTGRGMLPGESFSDWKARIKKMDEDNEVQQKALTK